MRFSPPFARPEPLKEARRSDEDEDSHARSNASPREPELRPASAHRTAIAIPARLREPDARPAPGRDLQAKGIGSPKARRCRGFEARAFGRTRRRDNSMPRPPLF